MTGASFASWVTGSDVVVAQTGQTLAVWYNVDAPEAVTLTPIKGDVVDIVREDGRTSVMVEEHGTKVAYLLDEGLIEFGTALHDNDFGRVVLFLENMGDSPQVGTMWENVATNAMNERKLMIAARCYAAMGDVACSKFLKEIIEVSFFYNKYLWLFCVTVIYFYFLFYYVSRLVKNTPRRRATIHWPIRIAGPDWPYSMVI